MAIITDGDLASYLRQPDADVALYTDLANGVVTRPDRRAVDPVPTRIKAITLEVAPGRSATPTATPRRPWTTTRIGATRTPGRPACTSLTPSAPSS
jgi:hypothetical protein